MEKKRIGEKFLPTLLSHFNNPLFKKLLFILIVLLISAGCEPDKTDKDNGNETKTQSPEKKYTGKTDGRGDLEVIRNKIPAIAESYLGMPYKLGAHPDHDNAADNSHLIFAIFDKAATGTGLKLKEYMPMGKLIANTREIKAEVLQNGDFIILNNGLAAMIHDVLDKDKFKFVYTSEKMRKVVSLHSRDKDVREYWFKNLKGYYRLTGDMFIRAGSVEKEIK